MIIQNITNIKQSFNIKNTTYTLAAEGHRGDSMELTAEQAATPVVNFLMSLGKIAEISKDEHVGKVQAAAVDIAAEREERLKQLKDLESASSTLHEEHIPSTVPVHCCAVTAKGERCSRSHLVPEDEIEENDKPVLWFCGQHKKENPDDYSYDEEKKLWIKRG